MAYVAAKTVLKNTQIFRMKPFRAHTVAGVRDRLPVSMRSEFEAYLQRQQKGATDADLIPWQCSCNVEVLATKQLTSTKAGDYILGTDSTSGDTYVVRCKSNKIMPHPAYVPPIFFHTAHLHDGPEESPARKDLQAIIRINQDPVDTPRHLTMMTMPEPTYIFYDHDKDHMSDIMKACMMNVTRQHGVHAIVQETVYAVQYILQDVQVTANYLHRINVEIIDMPYIPGQDDTTQGYTTTQHVLTNTSTGQTYKTAEAHIVIYNIEDSTDMYRKVPTQNAIDIINTVLHEFAHAFDQCPDQATTPSINNDHDVAWSQCMSYFISKLHAAPHGPALKDVCQILQLEGKSYAHVLTVFPFTGDFSLFQCICRDKNPITAPAAKKSRRC